MMAENGDITARVDTQQREGAAASQVRMGEGGGERLVSSIPGFAGAVARVVGYSQTCQRRQAAFEAGISFDAAVIRRVARV
jgi:hypothetical protein